jgi:hypothetical protein
MGFLDPARNWISNTSHRRSHVIVIAALVSGFVLMPLAGVYAFKQASNGIADAAFREIQGTDSGDVVDKITDKVVDKVLGDLDAKSLTQDFIKQLSGNVLKGQKLDINSSVARIEDQIGDELMSKLEGVDIDAMLAQASAQIRSAVLAKVNSIDLEKIAAQVVKQIASEIDVDKMMKELVAQVDVDKIVQQKMSSVNITQLLLASMTNRR